MLTSNRLCTNRAKKAKEPQSQNNKIKMKKKEKKAKEQKSQNNNKKRKKKEKRIKCLKINLDQLKKII